MKLAAKSIVAAFSAACALTFPGAFNPSALSDKRAPPDIVAMKVKADFFGQFYVKVTVNGSSFTALVDTGATPYISLSQEQADKAAIDTRDSQEEIFNTANGAVITKRVQARVAIDGCKTRLVEVVVSPSLATNPLLGAAALDDLPQFQIAGWKGRKTLFMSCEGTDEGLDKDRTIQPFKTTVVSRSFPQP